MKARLHSIAWILCGLFLLAAYWYSVHPAGFARAYTEDWCQADQARQLMADSLRVFGQPRFRTDDYLAPYGISLPYMPWGIEVSWLGSFFWWWNRDFPFQWFYFGLSLVGSYLGVGYILRRMRLSTPAAWGLALVVVLAHVPRHFKIWHHYEHLLQHWVYWSLFLDAWIWQRFWRERRWSLKLEAWRALCLLGMLGTAGYFWGPLILEWALVRGCMYLVARSRRKQGIPTEFEREPVRSLVLPVLIAVMFVVIDLRWFLPLAHEAGQLGKVWQGLGWYAPIALVFEPLWWDAFVGWLGRHLGFGLNAPVFTRSETVVTAGWFLWIPAVLGISRVSVRRGGPGLKTVLPFLIFLVIAILYIGLEPPIVQRLLRGVIPFMKFFRVASRWGLFLPEILGVIVALCWPELSSWFRDLMRRKPRWACASVGVFVALSCLELSKLLTPVTTMPPLSGEALRLLEGVRAAPGTTVLDLPFCLAGGNGTCSEEQCPNYPESTTAGCLHEWHDKKVYGIYASRLVDSQCELYHRAPYLSWFDAWRKQRCFTESEWTDFCRYLSDHSELSAILVYPEIWTGAGDPKCLAQFDAHLGAPLAEAAIAVRPVRGGEVPKLSRLLRYGARCR